MLSVYVCCYVADREVDVEIALRNNSEHLQLRWIQDNPGSDPEWAIDEIYIECDLGLFISISFEEDKELERFAGV